jgi:hypothetical protein
VILIYIDMSDFLEGFIYLQFNLEFVVIKKQICIC